MLGIGKSYVNTALFLAIKTHFKTIIFGALPFVRTKAACFTHTTANAATTSNNIVNHGDNERVESMGVVRS